MIRLIISTFLLLFFAKSYSQSCFIALNDMSGVVQFSSANDEVQGYSCELVEEIPFAEDFGFKVYDAGEYYLDSYKNEVSGFKDLIRNEINNSTQFYLSYAKYVLLSGEVRVEIDLELPTQWLEECYTSTAISSIRDDLYFKARSVAFSGNAHDYPDYQIRVLRVIINEVKLLKDCCLPSIIESDCNSCLTDNSVNKFFLNNSFDYVASEIINIDTLVDCLCESDSEAFRKKTDPQKSIESNLIDLTPDILVEIEESEIYLSEKAIQISELYPFSYTLVTYGKNYCEYNFDSLLNVFNESSISFWVHASNKKVFYKSKGVGDGLKIGLCNFNHRDALECILDRFQETNVNIFTEILNEFDNSQKDIVINVDCPPGDTTAQGQTIDALLGRLGILEIYINPSQFESANDYPFRIPATIMHEACHGLMSLMVLRAGGPAKTNWLNYNYYFQSYGNVGQTDECIMAANFIDRQAELLWKFNGKHMEPKNYLASAWGPYFSRYKGCKQNVDYTISELGDWYVEMRDSSPQPFPCL